MGEKRRYLARAEGRDSSPTSEAFIGAEVQVLQLSVHRERRQVRPGAVQRNPSCERGSDGDGNRS